MLGHRGFTHSILFVLLLGVAVASIEFRKEKIRFGSHAWLGVAAFFMAVTMTHGLLDAMTDGGLGVGFFIPFSAERYFFPWTPIQVSPIGASNSSPRAGLP